IYLIPFIWMVLSSFKLNADVLSIPIKILPPTWNFQSYPNALNYAGYNFPRYFLNSFIVLVFAVLLCLFLSTTAGYGFAKYKFKKNKLLFIVVMSTLMIPFEAIVIPLFLLVTRLNLQDTYLALIIPGGLTAFGVFLMRQFFYSIPDEIIEAARIDGATEWQIFWRVSMPLAKTAVLSLAILHGQWVWNLLLWPLVVISKPDMRTLPQGISLFSGVYFTPYPEQLAISVLACLPTLILFIFLSRNFMEGVALTGLKM
ncbi:MAG: carbohydrate ABC transporter permease, partial [Candidatus Atribacteria bacterium]|nr:carbohydrate ABC transporter permease [Candidatus Atribacteria bacterium]